MPSASTAADADHMRTIRVFALAVLAVLALASTAQAATIRFAHQDWHLFKSTGSLGQHWDPAMVSISRHVLTERIQGDVAGGIGSTHYQLRGRWDMDFRISAGAGKFVLLLAGHEGTPRNELDFAEGKVGDSNRREIIATRHWGRGRSHLKQHRARANFTRWHHITVVWKRHKMNVRLDGVRFAHFIRHISKTPMALKIQTAGANVGGAGADARLQVEHLKIS
jgi:Glycosyl hydrolases family 16